MLVINEAVNSRCGHPITANCSCGGHANQPAEGEYTGRYSKWYKGDKGDDQVANVTKPTPLPVPVWNFDYNKEAVVENAASEVYRESGMYAGAAAGQGVRNVQPADDKPTAMPEYVWHFPSSTAK